MKKIILKKDITLRKLSVSAGSDGYLIVQQDAKGGHLVTLPDGDLGFADVALAPNAITEIHWSKDDVRTYWSSVIMTSDSTINNPSGIINLVVDIVDTVSAKIKWDAPQGFEGIDWKEADLYYLILSSSPIDIDNPPTAIRLPIFPKKPNLSESYIIPDLQSSTRYYVALQSEKVYYGVSRKSVLSNVVTFQTTAQEGNPNVPKRIPIFYDKIYLANVHVAFKTGELFTNYPTFKRLANQDWIIDNAGVPSGLVPSLAVASYQSYGTHQPSWFNIQRYKVIFELDGIYDLDYIYYLQSSFNNRFSIHTSGDGVNWIKAFDRADTPINTGGDWTKVLLNSNAKQGIRFIQLGLYEGSGDVNAFVPYGTRVSQKIVSGKKYKRAIQQPTIIDGFGTNGFMVETDFDMMAKTTSITRLYTPTDWFMYGSHRNQGGIPLNQNTPDNIRITSKLSHLFDWDVKLRAALDAGMKDLMLTLTSTFPYLRATNEGDGSLTKPIDPSLNLYDWNVTTDPMSYRHVARIVGALAARWGFNQNAPDIYTSIFQEADNLKGLGLVKYYEFGNEMERSWQGVDELEKSAVHYAPEEMAAYLSALYDGHKGAMGAGFGIKGADPNAQLVMPGLMSINADYVSEMMIWWDAKRGVGDYPVDVFNFHHYNGYYAETDTDDYSSIPAYAVQPEIGKLVEDTNKFVMIRDLKAQNKQVWVTEFGYDEQKGGVYAAQDVSHILRARHKAVWILRSLLIYNQIGLEAALHYWYSSFDRRIEDVNMAYIFRKKFLTSQIVDGITSASDTNRKPLVGYWYIVAFRNAMQDYKFSHVVIQNGILGISETNIVSTLNSNLFVYAYKHKITGATILLAWLGVSTWEENTVDFSVGNEVTNINVLNFENQDLRLSENGVQTSIAPIVVSSSKFARITVTETPKIIYTSRVGTALLKPHEDIVVTAVSSTSVKLTWTDKNIGNCKTRVYISLQPSGFAIYEEMYRDNAETTITGLQENTQYFFRLQFVNETEVSAVSGTYDITTFRILEVPTNLIQTSATNTTIGITWNYPTGSEINIDGFVLSRSNSVNGEYLEIARIAKNLRAYTDTGLVSNTQYFYKVRSYKESSVSNYSLLVAISTVAPSYEPPAIQSAATNSAGSSIELTFDSDLKDEQTAINAFSIIERFSNNSILAHLVTAISLSIDRRKITLYFDIAILKTSSITVSYSASLGNLVSTDNYPVNTFSSFSVTNNVAVLFVPIVEWNDALGLTINKNTLFSATSGRAISGVKINAGAVATVQFSCNSQDSMFLGMGFSAVPEGFSTMDYFLKKTNGVIAYKCTGGSSGITNTQFTLGVLRFRTDGTHLYLEASYDNGLTFVELTHGIQPSSDLYIKVYNETPNTYLLNVVGRGLSANTVIINPVAPTNMIVDDVANTVTFNLNPAYPLSQHEYSTNYLSLTPNWTTCDTNPINIGDVNIPAGAFAIRVKGGTGRNPSPAIVSIDDIIGNINTNARIFVQKSNGSTVLYSTDSLDELEAWLATAIINQNITIQFNTSDTYYRPNTFAPTYNNGTYWVCWQSAVGELATIDGMNANASTLRLEKDYTIWKNIRIANADINNSGGCLIRGDYRKHIKLLDVVYDYGFCAVRATQKIEDWEIDGAIIRNTIAGSFRMNSANAGNSLANGNYTIDDPIVENGNVRIRNIYLDDVTNGGLIGDSNSRFSGAFVLKYTNNYILENVRPLVGDRLYDLGTFEVCNNILMKNVYGDRMYAHGCDGLELRNCYLPGKVFGFSDFGDSQNITVLHSLVFSSWYNIGKILKIRASIFPNGMGGKLFSPTHIPDIEDNNIFGLNASGKFIDLETGGSNPNFVVEPSNLAAYLATGKGQNSLWLTALSNPKLNFNPFGSLRIGSAGKQMITSVIEGITDDIDKNARVFPTDAGAFNGLRADENDVPLPPTVTVDNTYRTVVAVHPLGDTEILVSINNAAFVQYTGVITTPDTAIVAGYYRFKIKAATYRDESAVAYSDAMTAKPVDNSYEVLRTLEINFKGVWNAGSTDANVNNYAPDPVNLTTYSLGLIDDTGASSGVNINAFETGFVGNTAEALPAAAYIRSEQAMITALELDNASPIAKLKFTGLDNNKFYQLYIVSCSQYSEHQNTFSVGSKSVVANTGLSSPLVANGEFHVNPAVTKLNDIAPVSGEFVLQVQKTGAGWQGVAINYLIIEETNKAKPS